MNEEMIIKIAAINREVHANAVMSNAVVNYCLIKSAVDGAKPKQGLWDWFSKSDDWRARLTRGGLSFLPGFFAGRMAGGKRYGGPASILGGLASGVAGAYAPEIYNKGQSLYNKHGKGLYKKHFG